MSLDNCSDVCSRCQSITSTLNGLEALCSEEGYYFDQDFWTSHELNRKCRFCVLMWNTAHDLVSPIHLFARLEPNTSNETNSAEHPFHGQKLAGFFVKPKIDPKQEEHAKSSLNIPSGIPLLPSNLLDTKDWRPAQFSCFTLEDHCAAEVLTTGSKVLEEERRLVSEQVIERIKNCTKYHKKCAKPTGNFLPKRVIDLGPAGAQVLPRLYETNSSDSLSYLALSYCWGGQQELTTTRSTYQDYTQRLPIGSLSKSIRDAIDITGDLGFRYLWVNALCIIQDNDKDKMSEINVMGMIYRNAAATIAAANSPCARDGFLRGWPVYEPCELPLLLPSGELSTIYIEKVEKLMNLATGGPLVPLDSRGWTLQEFLLSSRVLHFGFYDLTWHCQTDISGGLFSTHTSFVSCSEYSLPRKNTNATVPDFPRRLPPSIFQGLQIEDESELKNVTKVWMALVENYSKRALSDERDRLPALAGLAGEIQKATKYGFVSGIWTHGLIGQLGWRGSNSVPKSQYQAASTSSTPSWSWVWQSLGVDFDLFETEEAEVLSCITSELSVQSSLTEIHGCKLVILGKMIRASRVKRRSGIQFRMDYTGLANGELDGNTHWLLLGYKNRGNSVGLVVQPTPDGNFVRLGQIIVAKRSKGWEHQDTKLQQITLI